MLLKNAALPHNELLSFRLYSAQLLRPFMPPKGCNSQMSIDSYIRPMHRPQGVSTGVTCRYSNDFPAPDLTILRTRKRRLLASPELACDVYRLAAGTCVGAVRQDTRLRACACHDLELADCGLRPCLSREGVRQSAYSTLRR